MTAPSAPTPIAAAKAEYEEQREQLFQTEGLFEDLDPSPVFRRGAAEYLLRLVTVKFRHDPDGPVWSVWALAPTDPRWDSWARHVARDHDRTWIYGIEHVWLTRDRTLRRALVHIHTGLILQPRTTPEGQEP